MNRKLKANKKLEFKDYQSEDVVSMARFFLGCYLHTKIDNIYTVARIVETEAYSGSCDRASHAYLNKRTPRTETIFQDGGLAYVYLIYGMHHLFNIVVNKKDNPDAVLIRAIEPLIGNDIMLSRRKRQEIDNTLTSGPGRLSQAMGITTAFNGIELTGDTIWISHGDRIAQSNISVSTRINVDYAGEDALLPWRFYIKDNIYVSK